MESSVIEQPIAAQCISPSPEVQQYERRKRRDFDTLASVYLLRADLWRYGIIRPETKRRIYEEEMTLFAEAIDAPLTTSFEQRYINGHLEAVDGTPLLEMLDNGLSVALDQAARDPSYAFNAYRAETDLLEGQQLEALMAGKVRGNTILSISAYPEEAARLHGDAMLIEKGYKPNRRLAFIRLFHKADEATLQATTISLDNSNLGAFRRVAARHGVIIPADATSEEFGRYLITLDLKTEDLDEFAKQTVHDYDSHLEAQTQERYQQGRRETQIIDAWKFITKQKDLVDYYLKQIEGLAIRQAPDEDTERAKKELTYNYWALLVERLERLKLNPQHMESVPSEGPIDQELRLLIEVQNAGHRAAANYAVLIACGGSIDMANNSLYDLSPSQALDSILIGAGTSQEIVWTKGYCRILGCPTAVTEKATMVEVGQCRVCRNCQKIYDDGDNPEITYALNKFKAARNKTRRQEV